MVYWYGGFSNQVKAVTCLWAANTMLNKIVDILVNIENHSRDYIPL